MHLVGARSERVARLGRRDGNRRDQPRGHARADRIERRGHGGSRGDAVVDDDHDLAVQVERRPTGSERALATLELDAFTLLDQLELFVGDAEHLDHVLIDDPDRTGRDRSHRQLGTARYAELSYDEHLEWQCRAAFAIS